MQINIEQYKHFSFDLWLTIIKSNPEFKLKRDTLLKTYFGIDKELKEVRDTVRYYDVLSNKISEINGRHVDRGVIFLQILNRLDYDISQIESQRLVSFFDQVDALFLSNMPIILWENFKNVAQEIINANKTISLLSNTAFIHGISLRLILEHLGILQYFSFEIFSDEVGFSKPNQKLFELTYEKANKLQTVRKNEILHIGDNKKADYDGALSYGFSAKLVNFN